MIKYILFLAFILRFALIITLAILMYPISALTGFTWSNCWIYVIRKYLYWGGYILFRKTEFNIKSILIWEHALWTPDLINFYSFVPTKNPYQRYLPPLLFPGRIVQIENKDDILKKFIHIKKYNGVIG